MIPLNKKQEIIIYMLKNNGKLRATDIETKYGIGKLTVYNYKKEIQANGLKITFKGKEKLDIKKLIKENQ